MQMRKFIPGLMLLLGLSTTVVLPHDTSAKGLVYEGSSTIGDALIPDAVKVFEKHTGVTFDKITVSGSSEGFKAVMAGEVAVAGMSRSLKRDEKNLKPYSQVIGYDGITVLVHKNNPVQNLTKQQVKDIFTGKITNWKDVGGQDAEVAVSMGHKAHGTTQVFQKDILDGAEFKLTKECAHHTECMEYVAHNTNAITGVTMSLKAADVKFVGIDNAVPSTESVKSGAYPFSRPLLLVAKEAPQGDLKKFFEFMLSDEGQKIVTKYFVGAK